VTEGFEHNPGDHEDPRAGITWFIGSVGMMMLAVTMLAVWALYYNVKADQVETAVVLPIREDVVELQRRQAANVRAGGFGRGGRSAGTVTRSARGGGFSRGGFSTSRRITGGSGFGRGFSRSSFGRGGGRFGK